MGGLQAVEFVEELEMQCSAIGNIGVVCVEGHLGEERPRRERKQCQQEKPRWIWHAG